MIESIVGRSFLPRGTGMVTRCPLILQLIRCPMNDRTHRNAKDGKPIKCCLYNSVSNFKNIFPDTLNVREFFKFNHSNEIFTDHTKIREEIEAETERLAGPDKNICSDPITLKVYSASVITLTLVDLPGIIQVWCIKLCFDVVLLK